MLVKGEANRDLQHWYYEFNKTKTAQTIKYNQNNLKQSKQIKEKNNTGISQSSIVKQSKRSQHIARNTETISKPKE